MLAVYRIASLRNDAVSGSRLQFTADTLGRPAVPAYIGSRKTRCLANYTETRSSKDEISEYEQSGEMVRSRHSRDCFHVLFRGTGYG